MSNFIAGVLVTLIVVTIVAFSNSSQTATLSVCDYEDSTNCVWPARIAGNGNGRSFISTDDEVNYVSHAVAEFIIGGR